MSIRAQEEIIASKLRPVPIVEDHGHMSHMVTVIIYQSNAHHITRGIIKGEYLLIGNVRFNGNRSLLPITIGEDRKAADDITAHCVQIGPSGHRVALILGKARR